jgi:hypothetical protein
MNSKTPRLMALMATMGLMAACSSGSGPSAASQVTFNIGTQGAGAVRGAFLSDTQATSSDTLVIDKVELVLRDIRFKRVEDDNCPTDDSLHAASMGGDNDGPNDNGHHDGGDNDGHDGHNDACESFNAGPFLLDLPLGPGVTRAFSVAIDTGTFNQLRIKIHKPENDSGDQKDIDFLTLHPDFQGVSIRATGTFNGVAFTYLSDLNAEQRIALIPPITVADSAANVDLTIKVDLATWFKDGLNLVDPNSANKGEANENLVRDNIRDSFHAFRDENHDCHNDDGSDDD